MGAKLLARPAPDPGARAAQAVRGLGRVAGRAFSHRRAPTSHDAQPWRPFPFHPPIRPAGLGAAPIFDKRENRCKLTHLRGFFGKPASLGASRIQLAPKQELRRRVFLPAFVMYVRMHCDATLRLLVLPEDLRVRKYPRWATDSCS